jgi:uncharacterized protein YbbC (DUF1343 family)
MKYSKFNIYSGLRWFKNTVLFSFFIIFSCQAQDNSANVESLETGAEQIQTYLPLLKDKSVAVVANQTSVIANEKGGFTHLVDSLLNLEINVKIVFAPEHGFRGKADAGEIVNDSRDTETGLPIISLYGKHKKPTEEDLKGIDVVVFDIQDVGVRFYTYISTLHYVMEACAEQNIPMLVLDRPNPNRHYVDGPVLEDVHKSFVGMHPVPVVYGMTIGEYAKMINGEGWLKNSISCDLIVIKLKNYNPDKIYELPIKPSPNLPNAKSINLYPSLCFFEGTNVNAGRGTDMQFQVFGSPFLDKDIFDFQYTPQPNEGAKYPKHQGVICYGKDLRNAESLSSINLDWLIEANQNSSKNIKFFNPFFAKLAGTGKLEGQINSGMSAKQIKASWQKDLDDFMKIRATYLLYK